MPASLSDSIAEYKKERNAMLAKENVDDLLDFMRKHELPLPSSRAVAEILLHKAITAANTLPLDLRRRSKAWLTARSCTSLDDGDL